MSLNSMYIILFVSLIAITIQLPASAQVPQKDLTDLVRKILNKHPDTTQVKKVPALALLPSLAYNPSLGFLIGVKASAGRQFGNASSTSYSLFGFEAIYTSKGIISIQARHNIFSPGNSLNFQGNWQVAKFAVMDYGIGSGRQHPRKSGLIVNDYSTETADSAFPIKYNYIRISEKVYRKIGPHLFAGAGININIYTKIDDIKLSNDLVTPHQAYSVANGFNPVKYATNGLSFALQYNTREHPSRSYGGIYADMSIQFNQEWLGSSSKAIQWQYDFRKYWSLSKKHPEHVLAFWHWASYQLSGIQPYLQLPGTATDTYNRSGRGYTIGYFKGPSYAYFETEYRFPIMANGLLSGVLFINEQTASNAKNENIYSNWKIGAGAGLRLLFQKESRTTMCIDYGRGQFGSSGFFFGLNEVF